MSQKDEDATPSDAQSQTTSYTIQLFPSSLRTKYYKPSEGNIRSINYTSISLSRQSIKSNSRLSLLSDDVPSKPVLRHLSHSNDTQNTPSLIYNQAQSHSNLPQKKKTSLQQISSHNLRNITKQAELTKNNDNNIASTALISQKEQSSSNRQLLQSKIDQSDEIVEVLPKKIRRQLIIPQFSKKFPQPGSLPIDSQKTNLIDHFIKASETTSLASFDDYLKKFQTNYKRKLKQAVRSLQTQVNPKLKKEQNASSRNLPTQISSRSSQDTLLKQQYTTPVNLGCQVLYRIQKKSRRQIKINYVSQLDKITIQSDHLNQSETKHIANSNREFTNVNRVRQSTAPTDSSQKNNDMHLDDCSYYGTQFSHNSFSPDHKLRNSFSYLFAVPQQHFSSKNDESYRLNKDTINNICSDQINSNSSTQFRKISQSFM